MIIARKILSEDGMFWGILALVGAIWFMAILYIIKGWSKTGETPLIETEILKGPPPKEEPQEEKRAKKEEEPAEAGKDEEIEISIGTPRREEARTTTDLEGFYQEFGKPNIVEFPAEYIDRDSVKGISGSKIEIVEFAKNCYREIGFQSINSIMAKEEKGRTYKVNIFDLISDHYANTDEKFISFFGHLKDKFSQEIESLNSNPDITPENKRALVGKHDVLPQLVAWNNEELFLVIVKSKQDILNKNEIDFLKEFIIEKKLFKAKIFRIIEKQPKKGEKKEEVEVKTEDRKPVASEINEKTTRKPFTKEEIKFLRENKDKLTNEELAKKLGRSVDSVTHKLSRAGIARENYEWTKDKDRFLKKNITKLSYRELSEKLGATVPSIRARCKKIEIRK